MLIIGNWKTYVRTREKAKKLLAAAKRLAIGRKMTIVIAPPAPYLGLLVGNRGNVALASQDLSDTMETIETGEITAPILKELGVKYSIIGHSERRARGESDERINEKVKRALVHGIIPILCIGEHEHDSEARYLSFVRNQIVSAFKGLSPKESLEVVIAYEPVWAIGKGTDGAIQSHDLNEMVLYIRKILGDFIPGKGSLKVKVLYGAAVTPENARALVGGGGVDGLLVGHSSADPVTFTGIVKALK